MQTNLVADPVVDVPQLRKKRENKQVSSGKKASFCDNPRLSSQTTLLTFRKESNDGSMANGIPHTVNH